MPMLVSENEGIWGVASVATFGLWQVDLIQQLWCVDIFSAYACVYLTTNIATMFSKFQHDL